MRETIHSALSDLACGLRLHGLWLALATEDIGDQHRRTTLGPLWMLINYLAFAVTFIFVFTGAARTPTYPAYVATGLLVWFYIMEVFTQGVSLFRREESFIRGTTLPLSVYVLRLWAQSTIRAAYALAGCLAILLLSATPISGSWYLALIGLCLILAAAPAAIILCAVLGTYVHDSQFIVANLIRLGMFLTPVFWISDSGNTVQAAFYAWNPFTYFLEIVRLPILADSPPIEPFLIAGAATALLWAMALFCLGRYRRHVAFVL